MDIKIGQTTSGFNTQYAPLAVLLAHYQAHNLLKPLESVPIQMKSRDFTPADKLSQVLVSMLAGCETISEVNRRLKPELNLARIGDWPRFADQSTLSRTLDALTQKQIACLREAIHSIWWPRSQVQRHDWRGYLWLDFDLSGLPCSARAQESQRGYFSGKKTSPAVNLLESAPSVTGKLSGQVSLRATATPSHACNQRSRRRKML